MLQFTQEGSQAGTLDDVLALTDSLAGHEAYGASLHLAAAWRAEMTPGRVYQGAHPQPRALFQGLPGCTWVLDMLLSTPSLKSMLRKGRPQSASADQRWIGNLDCTLVTQLHAYELAAPYCALQESKPF